MPALVMRGRYLMREFWSDSDLFLKLDAQTREVYMGLWMLADDDGWLPRDVPGIAAALFRYMDREPRERLVTESLSMLGRLGKVQSLRCCLFCPSVARYPRAGKKSASHHDDHRLHQTHSNQTDAKPRAHSKPFEPIQTDLNPSPVVNPSLPDPSSRTGAPARGGAPSAITESDFRSLVPIEMALGKKAAS
jgi:hypothetical protein